MKKITRSSIIRYIAIILIVILAFCDGIAALSGIYMKKIGDKTDLNTLYENINQDEMISTGDYVCYNYSDGLFYSSHDGTYYLIDKIRVFYEDKDTEEFFSEPFEYSSSNGKYICDEDAKYVLDTSKMKVGNCEVSIISDLLDNSFYVSDESRISVVCELTLKKDNWTPEKQLTSVDWAYEKANNEIDDIIYNQEGFDRELYQTIVEPVGQDAVLYIAMISLIIVLLGLFVLTSAGHKNGSEEIELTFWDNIGWFVHGLIMFSLVYIVTLPFIMTESPFCVFENIQKTNQLVIIASLLAIFVLLGGWFLETTVIRIKAKCFWKTTTIYHLYSALRKPFIAGYDKFRRYKDGLTGVGQIMQDTKSIVSGEKDSVNVEKVDPAYQEFANNINILAEGKTKAVDEMLKSERMRSELITNVSHDIKTPLTSIISYTDLLSKKNFDDVEAKEYISVITSQSTRLKTLLEDLIEASKASSGVLPVNMEELQIDILLTQILSEYEDRLSAKHLSTVVSFPEETLPINTDGKHLSRVFCNLLSNVCKYSLEGTRVYVSLQQDEHTVVTIKNTSSEQLNISPEELKERFSRGDSSRTKEGSGLGLAITESLMELIGGSLDIDIDGDLFKVSITL